MSKESVDRFCEAIEKQIQYFAKEYDMTIAEAVGCLEVIKFQLMKEFDDD